MAADYELMGKSVRKYRRAADLTQEKLADMVGVSLSHVNAIENANGIPSFEVLAKIADALDVTLDQLCYGSVRNPNGYLMDGFNRLTDGFDVKQKRCAADMAIAVWEQYREFVK